MISDGLWVPHLQRKPRIYQPRYRRDCFGEFIQNDGSHHYWFEERSDKYCLLVFIDDATDRLMNLRFSKSESAFDYIWSQHENTSMNMVNRWHSSRLSNQREIVRMHSFL